jgi:hypothetical protein
VRSRLAHGSGLPPARLTAATASPGEPRFTPRASSCLGMAPSSAAPEETGRPAACAQASPSLPSPGLGPPGRPAGSKGGAPASGSVAPSASTGAGRCLGGGEAELVPSLLVRFRALLGALPCPAAAMGPSCCSPATAESSLLVALACRLRLRWACLLPAASPCCCELPAPAPSAVESPPAGAGASAATAAGPARWLWERRRCCLIASSHAFLNSVSLVGGGSAWLMAAYTQYTLRPQKRAELPPVLMLRQAYASCREIDCMRLSRCASFQQGPTATSKISPRCQATCSGAQATAPVSPACILPLESTSASPGQGKKKVEAALTWP